VVLQKDRREAQRTPRGVLSYLRVSRCRAQLQTNARRGNIPRPFARYKALNTYIRAESEIM
jgi:hypothetical protein